MRIFTNCLGIGFATLSALAYVDGTYVAMVALALMSVGMAVISRQFPPPGELNRDLE